MPGLPPELIRRIVSYFRCDSDYTFLKRACLVSSSFRKPCQEVLFSELALYPSEDSFETSIGQRFLSLLDESPFVARYVKSLTILANSGAATKWLASDEALEAILGRLAALQIITDFTFVYITSGQWYTVPAQTRESIEGLCQSPSLSSLSIEYGPICLVTFASPSIKRLTLTNLIVESDCMLPSSLLGSTTPIHRPKLKQLNIHPHPTRDLSRVIPFLVGPSASVDITGLEVLSVTESSMPIEEYGLINCLLLPCASSLRVLALTLDPTGPLSGANLRSFINLSTLANLRELSIQVNNFFRRWQEPRGLHLLPSLLKATPLAGSLESFNLYIIHHHGTYQRYLHGGELDLYQYDVWQEIDVALTDKKQFPELRRVKVTVVDDYFSGKPTRQWVEECIPLVKRGGLLEARAMTYLAYEA
ncbi:hypothetical protein FA15DRAFT_68565 [Coprinopsis marcescibilis]|uniref:F-box domain-containing protein n=1 Tax=Coprinopsis marcescibilis TaxID=230819 RepID=A0A5C3KMS4_COPMA|nr:hypothetical protein FA15DRAFT_68565 [Coprinopsis marcescibilis]